MLPAFLSRSFNLSHELQEIAYGFHVRGPEDLHEDQMTMDLEFNLSNLRILLNLVCGNECFEYRISSESRAIVSESTTGTELLSGLIMLPLIISPFARMANKVPVSDPLVFGH
jgi:hypothetical protein